MSQKGIVLDHLKRNGKISSWEAIQEYHITRLAAVIALLREDGHKIDSIPQYTQKADGSRGRKYALYVLRKEKEHV